MIELKNLNVFFNKDTALESHALCGVNLSIRKGEFVTIIGSNGAGKSTLLNTMSGEVPIDTGEILINDLHLESLSVSKRAGFIGKVFQDPRMGTCEDLTVEENLSLAQKRGVKRGLSWAVKSQQRAALLAKLKAMNLGLEDKLKDRMGQLSGGQRQAISLLMATLQPMHILLLDEHTAALDPNTAEIVMNLTDQYIKDYNLTAVMVTHSMAQALQYGTRTIMMHEGNIAFDLSGEQREKCSIKDLLDQFAKLRGTECDDDALLL